MKSKIAVYDTHEKAVKGIKSLTANKIDAKQISLIGKAENKDNHIQHINKKAIEEGTVFIGAGAGVLTGLLSGLGLFVIPGFGFLYGVGAVVGAIGGLDLGIMAGGLSAVAEAIGLKGDKSADYEKHLNEGNYIVIVQGDAAVVDKAEKILHTEGTLLILD